MKFLNQILLIILLIPFAAFSAEEPEVSAPSFCAKFNVKHIESLKKEKILLSLRELRDLYMECDLDGKYLESALYYAKLVAEASNSESDKHELSVLIEASRRK